jgi:hypothetical protein
MSDVYTKRITDADATFDMMAVLRAQVDSPPGATRHAERSATGASAVLAWRFP